MDNFVIDSVQEKNTKKTAIAHFLLMFGYKMFSLYFPLFLAARHFSVPQVGYAVFLIYLPIALAAPVTGLLSRKSNPAVLASFGALGYGLYSFGMLMFPQKIVIYFLQIMLGVAGALFFVGMRTILMRSDLESADKSFSWFYTAPSYAKAIAPAVGAVLIWKFDFAGVFTASLAIHLLTAVFCFVALKDENQRPVEKMDIKKSLHNYSEVAGLMKEKRIFPYIAISFFMLILAGFSNTFFVLFLKDLGWTQNKILIFNSLLSLTFLPIAFFATKTIGKVSSQKNISRGSRIAGIFYILLGLMANVLTFVSTFFIMIFASIGELMAGSGRSGLITLKLKKYPEEAAAIDTIFSPLARAAGALSGGFLIIALGYPLIFIFGGVFIFAAGFLFRKSKNRF